MVVIEGAIPFSSTINEVLSLNAKNETVSLDINPSTAVWKNPYATTPAPSLPHEPPALIFIPRDEIEKEEDQKLVDMVEKVDKLQVHKDRMHAILTDIRRFENKRAAHRSHEVVTTIRNQVITKMHEIAAIRHKEAIIALERFSHHQYAPFVSTDEFAITEGLRKYPMAKKSRSKISLTKSSTSL